MTVAEMIALLKTHPQAAQVVTRGPDHTYWLTVSATLRDAEPGDGPRELYEAGSDIKDPVKVVVLS